MATQKMRDFITAYVGPANFNGTEAARLAKYKGNDVTLASIAYENLRKPQIRDEIKRILNDRAMSREEVVHRIGEQARGNMGDFVRLEQRVRPDFELKTNEDGEVEWIEKVEHYEVMELDLRAAKEAGKLGLVKKVKFDKDGGVSFELYSSQTALEMLGRVHGIFEVTDRSDKTLMKEMHEAMTEGAGEYSGDRPE